jgi:exodeoxyribonuclease VII small subunit
MLCACELNIKKEKIMTELSFEEALAQLETLVKRLEEGRLPLDEAVTVFEKGAALKTYCEQKLQAAKLKVDQVVGLSNDGVVVEPFDT